MKRYQRCLSYLVTIMMLYSLVIWNMYGEYVGGGYVEMVDESKGTSRPVVLGIREDDRNSRIADDLRMEALQKHAHRTGQVGVIVSSNTNSSGILHDTKSQYQDETQHTQIKERPSSVVNVKSNNTIVSVHNSSMINQNDNENSDTVAKRKENEVGREEEFDSSSVEAKTQVRHGVPTLALCTSLEHDRRHAESIHTRTIRNWASLSPKITPYLFPSQEEDDKWSRRAHRNGWGVLKLPKYEQGKPTLRDMLTFVESDTEATFVGFAKPDILFGKSLLNTLEYLKRAVRNIDHRELLLTGRRHDFISTGRDFQVIGKGEDLEKIQARALKTEQAEAGALDFVIVPRGTFKWSELPELLLDGLGAINWVVAKALESNFIVMEVSSSLHVLHQTDEKDKVTWTRGGDYSEDHNINLLHQLDTYYENTLDSGNANCIAFITICRRWSAKHTEKDSDCNFALAKRKRLPASCGSSRGAGTGGKRRRRYKAKKDAEEEYIDIFDGSNQQW